MNQTKQESMSRTFSQNMFKNFKSNQEIPRPSSSNSRKISLNLPETNNFCKNNKNLPPIFETKKDTPFTAKPIDSPKENYFNKQISPWNNKQKHSESSEKSIFKELLENVDQKTNPFLYRKIKELENCIEEKNKLSNFKNQTQQGKILKLTANIGECKTKNEELREENEKIKKRNRKLISENEEKDLMLQFLKNQEKVPHDEFLRVKI